MKLLIVAKDAERIAQYRKEVSNIADIDMVGESMSAEDALFFILNEGVDLVLSEAVLPVRSGFQLASTVVRKDSKVLFIVIAPDESYAIDAIKSQVFDFLIEPVTKGLVESSVRKAVEVLLKKKESSSVFSVLSSKLKLNTPNGYKIIDVDDIAFCKSDGSYTIISFHNGTTCCVALNIGKIERTLSPLGFIRVNRSTVMNLKILKRIERFRHICVVNVGGKEEEIVISKQYVPLV